jgi:hypothetical protein
MTYQDDDCIRNPNDPWHREWGTGSVITSVIAIAVMAGILGREQIAPQYCSLAPPVRVPTVRVRKRSCRELPCPANQCFVLDFFVRKRLTVSAAQQGEGVGRSRLEISGGCVALAITGTRARNYDWWPRSSP